MMMRYHIGLGVGHVYAHGKALDCLEDSSPLAEDPDEDPEPANHEAITAEPDEVEDLGAEEDLDVECDRDTDASETDEEELIQRMELYGR